MTREEQNDTLSDVKARIAIYQNNFRNHFEAADQALDNLRNAIYNYEQLPDIEVGQKAPASLREDETAAAQAVESAATQLSSEAKKIILFAKGKGWATDKAEIAKNKIIREYNKMRARRGPDNTPPLVFNLNEQEIPLL